VIVYGGSRTIVEQSSRQSSSDRVRR